MKGENERMIKDLKKNKTKKQTILIQKRKRLNVLYFFMKRKGMLD